jgi:hypothetical protein
MFAGRARGLPRSGAPERSVTWFGSGLTNIRLVWIGLPGDKHSNLKRKIVNNWQEVKLGPGIFPKYFLITFENNLKNTPRKVMGY